MSKEDEFPYKGTRGTFTFNNIALVKPRFRIHNAGEFFLNDNNKLDFEGDTEEAGRLFVEYVCKTYNDYIENLLAEERKKVAEEIEANFKKRVGISTEKAIQYLDRLKDIRIPIRNPKYIKESK
jgi:hypothetical protein